MINNGSIRGRGNCAHLQTLNTAAAAARRYTVGTTTGYIQVRHLGEKGPVDPFSEPIYYAYGRDLPGIADGFVADASEFVLDTNGAAFISFWSASDLPSILLCEVA